MSSRGRKMATHNNDERGDVRGLKRAINQTVGRVMVGCKPPQKAAVRFATKDLFISE